MNKALQLLMAAALVTGFAACSSDDDMSTANNFPQDGVVRFNVGVNFPRHVPHIQLMEAMLLSLVSAFTTKSVQSTHTTTSE